MFRNRIEAGRRLAEMMLHLRGEDVVVLGLPRGGVPVADEVARALGAPLDVIVVRKLGHPHQPELAVGAIGEGGARVVDLRLAEMVGAGGLEAVERRERAELERRARLFRSVRSRLDLTGKVAVIVDDGIATGSTVRAAIQVARAQGARRVVVATPVAPSDVERRLGQEADEVIVAETPETFYAIGQFYRDFSPTPDSAVVRLLERAQANPPTPAGEVPGVPAVDDEVELVVGSTRLQGRMTVPHAPLGMVVFAHGSGSSRHSPRNRFVASSLNDRGLATLLFDLLTSDEARDRYHVFDIGLLGRRLVEATEWLVGPAGWGDRPIGYFGASTGAAAALHAAAELGSAISAVVSRGGRPDLALSHLERVTAPTLLIVGGRDLEVIEMNRTAQGHLRCESRLEVVPGAGHLFEEPGALERVAELAGDWFVSHLTELP